MDINGDSAAVVANRNRAIDVNGNLDAGALTCQMFIDRIVEHLRNTMVQRPFIGASDVHSGLLPDGLQSLQLSEHRGVIGFALSGGLKGSFVFHQFRCFRHTNSNAFNACAVREDTVTEYNFLAGWHNVYFGPKTRANTTDCAGFFRPALYL